MKAQRIKWTKKELAAKFTIGTPMAFVFGYPTSKFCDSFGVVTGYDNETYRSTWALIVTRCDGHEFTVVPDRRTCGYDRFSVITKEDLERLEAKFNHFILTH